VPLTEGIKGHVKGVQRIIIINQKVRGAVGGILDQIVMTGACKELRQRCTALFGGSSTEAPAFINSFEHLVCVGVVAETSAETSLNSYTKAGDVNRQQCGCLLTGGPQHALINVIGADIRKRGEVLSHGEEPT